MKTEKEIRDVLHSLENSTGVINREWANALEWVLQDDSRRNTPSQSLIAWAREAREWMEMYFETGGFNLTRMKHLLVTYPKGDGNKSTKCKYEGKCTLMNHEDFCDDFCDSYISENESMK